MKALIRKRIIPWLLTVTLIVSMTGAPVYADAEGAGTAGETTEKTAGGGLCKHHPEHTDDCGYTEGTPCTHEHTDECYREVTVCTHKHTEECYSDEYVPDSDNPATPSDLTPEDLLECGHVCGEDTGCITKQLYCPHENGEHDENCGYSEGTPCTYECEICANAGLEASCTCDTPCVDGAVNADCPVCGAEGADLADCKGKKDIVLSEAQQAFTDAVAALDKEELLALAQTYADAFTAFNALDRETADEEDIAEAEKAVAEAENAFYAKYDKVEGTDGTSALELYDALTEDEQAGVAESYAILQDMIDSVNEVLGVFSGDMKTTYEISGTGTEADPYLVGTAEDWVALNAKNSNYLSGKYIKLKNDIDLTGKTWSVRMLESGGHLDGDGHMLSGLTQPLFSWLSESTVVNLAVEADIDYTQLSDGPYKYVGVIAEQSEEGASLENCYVIGSVKGIGSAAGGLIGNVRTKTTIKNCVVDVDVENTGGWSGGSYGAGGLVGCVSTSNCLTIEKCYTVGTVKASAREAGGLVGMEVYPEFTVTITDSAALQSDVSNGNYKSYEGRIVGTTYFSTANFNNVYGYEGMTGKYHASGFDTGGINGISVSKADCTSAAFWTDILNFDESVWNIEDGMLPALAGVEASTGEPPLYLAQTGSISGKVADLDGSEVEGAAVTFTSESGNETTVTTDGTGVYTAELAEGVYDVTVRKTGYLTVTEAELTIAGETTRDFTLDENPVLLGDDTAVDVSFSTTDEENMVGNDTVGIVYTGEGTLAVNHFAISSAEDELTSRSGVSVSEVTNAAVTVQFAKSLDITSEPAYLFYTDSCVGQITLNKTVNKVLLEKPTNAAWDTVVPGKATWSAVAGAAGYSVQLYRDDVAQDEPAVVAKTEKTAYDFTSVIAETGNYTFKVKAAGDDTYGDSEEAVSGVYAFTEQTLETVKAAAEAALAEMETSNDTTPEDVLKVVSGLITNKKITAVWSETDGFSKTDSSVGEAEGRNGSITGTIVLTIEPDGNTENVSVNLTIAPRFTASFTGGDNATGDVPADLENLKEGTVITLPSNTFRMPGKVFESWSDGGNTYGAGVSYTMPGTNAVFTAQWTDDIWDGTTVSTALEGKGTPAEPHLIYNGADLAYFQGGDMWNAKLMADIDLGEHPFTAIKELQGTFDGNNHVIRGLNLTKTDLVYTGLFQQLRAGNNYTPLVESLAIENAEITYSATNNGGQLGILAGGSYGAAIIRNCYVTGTIDSGTPTGDYTGGLIGWLSGGSTVEKCYAGVNFSGNKTRFIGGLVGASGGSGVNIRNSYATPILSTVQAPERYGGILGANSAVITNCYAAGQSLSSSGLTGGIAPNANISGSVSIFPEMSSLCRITWKNQSGTLSNNYGYAGMIARRSDGTIQTPEASDIGTGTYYGADASKTQLESQDFYQDMLGWDFGSTWQMDSGYAYPVLQGQTVLPDLALDMTPAVTSVTLDKTAVTLPRKGSVKLTATVDVVNGEGRMVAWSSSDYTNVVVDPDGNVTVSETAAAGTYTITAASVADVTKFAQCIITVDTGSHTLINEVENQGNSPKLTVGFYSSLNDAQAGANPITGATAGAEVYIALRHVSTEDVTTIEVTDAAGTKVPGTLYSSSYVSAEDGKTDIYFFTMPCTDVTVGGYTAESLNQYNYAWFVGQEWSSWGTTATYETKTWDNGAHIGWLKVTSIINGKKFKRFNIKSVSLYKEGQVSLIENTTATDAEQLGDKEYCTLYDAAGLPALYVKLEGGAGTISVDIEVEGDADAVFSIAKDSGSSGYFTLDKDSAKAGDTVTATLTDAAVRQIEGDETSKTNAVLTYYGGLLVVAWPPVFSKDETGKWTASFSMPAQDITARVYFSAKTEVTLIGSNRTVFYNGQPQSIDGSISAVIGNTDVSEALHGRYEVTYTGTEGTAYGPTSSLPVNAGTYSCAVKIPDADMLYSGVMSEPVTLTIEKATPKTPSAPGLQERSETSITLKSPTAFADGTVIPGDYTVEYGIEGRSGQIEWQDSPEFSGLAGAVTYSFYARIKTDGNNNASEKSEAAAIRTVPSAPSALAAQIDFAEETIACDDIYEMSRDSGFLADQYLASGATITELIGKTIYIRVKSMDGEPASAVTEVSIPSRPTEVSVPVIDYRNETITVSEAEQYKIGSGIYADGSGAAQSIAGDIPGSGMPEVSVTYYLKATESAFKSSESTIMIPARPAAPAAPAAEEGNIGDGGITLTAIAGGEYRCGEGAWQENPVFSGLDPNTEYTFYQHYTATGSAFVSEVSAAVYRTKKRSLAEATVTLSGIDGFTYDGNSHIPASVEVKLGGKVVDAAQYDVSYENSRGGLENTTDAGSVTVTVTARADGNYTGSADSRPVYTIAPKAITAVVSAADKIYDGDTAAAVTVTAGAEQGIIGGDVLNITAEGAFADKNAGTEKTVTITRSSIRISGTGAANYDVTVPDTAIAGIMKKEVDVTIAGDIDVTYGTAYTHTATYTPVDGDTVDAVIKYDGLATRPAEVKMTGGRVDAYSLTAEIGDHNYVRRDYTADSVRSFTINQAAVPGAKDAGQSLRYNKTGRQTVTAEDFGIALAGIFTADGAVSDSKGVLDAVPVYGREVQYQLKENLSFEAQDVTIPVIFTPDNTSYAPVALVLTVNLTDRSVATLELTASKTADIVYGDNVTYTAVLDRKDVISDAFNALDGSVQFYLDGTEGENRIGSAQTVTDSTKAVSITLDRAALTAGSHTVYAVYGGNENFSGVTAQEAAEVARRILNWDVSGLSALKRQDGSQTASIDGSLLVSGTFSGEDAGFTYTRLTGVYDSAEAGSRTVTVTVVGAAVANPNYALPSGNPVFTGKINAVEVLPEVPESGNGVEYRLEQEQGISTVPEELKENQELNTPEKLERQMMLSVVKSLSGVREEDIEVYDITLLFSTDGGATWQVASKENFPAGGITVTLPYPEGTGRSGYDFIVTHMFTTGEKAGSTEKITPSRTADGLRFTLHSLSPVAVGYKISESTGGNSGGSSGGGSGSGSSRGSATGQPGWRLGSGDYSGQWRYYNSDGSFVADSWKQIPYNGTMHWYHFDKNGYMETGWFRDIDGSWYYLNQTSDGTVGMMLTGWITDPQDQHRYYLDPVTGRMLTGWQVIDGVRYYFNEQGPEQSGWYWNALQNAWAYEDKKTNPLGMWME